MNVKKFTYDFLNLESGQPLVKNDNLPELAPIPVEVVAEPPKPKYIFTEEDMQLGRKFAQEEGAKMGEKEALHRFQEHEGKKSEHILQILQGIETQVTSIALQEEERSKAIEAKLKILAMAAAEKVIGDAMARNGAEAIEQYIKAAFVELRGQENLKLHLNPEQAKVLKEKFTKVEVVEDDHIGLNDFRIQWENGFAERKIDEIWKEIQKLLAN